jgi:hypothetical protein
VKSKLHLCQSVSGAIRNWDKKTWEAMGQANGMSGDRMKEKFRIMEFEGVKVIPMSEECEGFSDQTGCPGHPHD